MYDLIVNWQWDTFIQGVQAFSVCGKQLHGFDLSKIMLLCAVAFLMLFMVKSALGNREELVSYRTFISRLPAIFSRISLFKK